MEEQIKRDKRIIENLNLYKIPYYLENNDFKNFGIEVSNFIHHIFSLREKAESLNWCFANIKRIKI